MIVSNKEYEKMPEHLRKLFVKLPNPGSDEVMEAFAAAGGGGSGSGVVKISGGSGMAFFNDGVSKHNDWVRDFVDTGTAARFFYCAKASKADRAGSTHPTIKPIALIRYLCRLITPLNGTVLDPFAGSGTTGEAALREGFNALLIEQDQQSVKDSKWRSRVVRGVTSPWWGYEE